jgi:hypothetical protein
MTSTVRFKLSRDVLVAPGVTGRRDEVINATPIQAAELITVAAGELLNPTADHMVVMQAVKRWWTQQPRLDRQR